MHKRVLAGALSFAGLAALAIRAAAGPDGLAEPAAAGSINWSKGYIEAVGEGIPSPKAQSPGHARILATRAATVDGQRKLLEVVKAVRVDSKSMVQNFMLESDVVTTTVQGVIKGAMVLDEQYGDTSIKVRVRAPIWGNLADAVYTHLLEKEPAPKQYPLRESPFSPWRRAVRTVWNFFFGVNVARADTQLPGEPPAEPPRPEIASATKTGLILDFTDIKAKPEMYPTIRDDQGVAIVLPSALNRNVAVDQGAVAYAASVDEAKKSPRAGDDPLVVKALNFAASTDAGIKVSFEDAKGTATFSKSLKDPASIFKNGVTIAYRVTW